ncbi:hypothetical protein SDC9_53738 [bioreactor metagenome]|uniref:Uncharacterized protein n=1 Tax=bioreactor metagenome TaxID=1076179 RepID=A0A644WUD6_9ZZZZ
MKKKLFFAVKLSGIDSPRMQKHLSSLLKGFEIDQKPVFACIEFVDATTDTQRFDIVYETESCDETIISAAKSLYFLAENNMPLYSQLLKIGSKPIDHRFNMKICIRQGFKFPFEEFAQVLFSWIQTMSALKEQYNQSCSRL